MSNKINCETSLDINFVSVIEALNQKKIQYWVCHGTLLGLIRDGGLIPWDHDIDIAIWYDSISKVKIIQLMNEYGFTLKSDGADYDFLSFTRNGGREVDFNLYRVSVDSGLAYSEWFIPRSQITRILGMLANSELYEGKFKYAIKSTAILSPFFKALVDFFKSKNIFYRSAGYTTPTYLLKEFKLINCSGLIIRVPLLCEKVIAYVYGEDWRVPKQRYDWKSESPSTRISSARF